MPELSRRPYLLRAMLDWIVDCGWTPHLIVDATVEGVEVPRQFVKEGRIVLNIS
ncbi:MAG: ClpXP protease specificity-enhancing factor SspB, partial [Pseudomonadota bacterium]